MKNTVERRQMMLAILCERRYEKIDNLYEGQDLRNNHSNSDMSLMNRLAYWCNGDKEQMLRIFATSGLYRPEKSDGYYEGTAIKAVRDTTSRYSVKPKTPPSAKPSSGSDKGGK